MPGASQEEAPLVVGVVGSASGAAQPDPARQLSTFFGVIVPTVLSMFSIVVFMRVGEWLGSASVLQWPIGPQGLEVLQIIAARGGLLGERSFGWWCYHINCLRGSERAANFAKAELFCNPGLAKVLGKPL